MACSHGQKKPANVITPSITVTLEPKSILGLSALPKKDHPPFFFLASFHPKPIIPPSANLGGQNHRAKITNQIINVGTSLGVEHSDG